MNEIETYILDQKLTMIIEELTPATFPRSTKEVIALMFREGIYSEFEATYIGNSWDSLNFLKTNKHVFLKEIVFLLGKQFGQNTEKIFYLVNKL